MESLETVFRSLLGASKVARDEWPMAHPADRCQKAAWQRLCEAIREAEEHERAFLEIECMCCGRKTMSNAEACPECGMTDCFEVVMV